MRNFFLSAALFASLAAPLSAECPCVPITHLWTVKTCSDWNCANTELLLAGGDPQVMAIPVGIDDGRWLVVRRSAAGAAIQDPNDPFVLDQFEGMSNAVDHYTTMGADMKPRLMTAPDGRVLVIALKYPEPPPARRHPSQH